VWATNQTTLLGLTHGAILYGPTLAALRRITAIAADTRSLWVAGPTGLVRVNLATLP
jgi:hypothetical protein